jgi:hypothetical protein
VPEANGQAPAPAGDANIYSSKLNAIMRLLLGAETDEEFAAARQLAAQIRDMSDEDARALLGGQEPGAATSCGTCARTTRSSTR